MLHMIMIAFLVLFLELAGVGILTLFLKLLCSLKKN